MSRKSHYERTEARIAEMIAYDALCPLEDADLIHAWLAEAVEKDYENRGWGIRRRGWSLDTWPQQQHDTLFRMERDEIYELIEELRFPQDEWVVPSGSRFTAEEAFTAFLRRLSYPTSLLAMSNEGFRAQPGQLSELFHTVSLWIYEHYTDRLLRDGFLWWADRIPGYAKAISDQTGVAW